jgi:hypothetical protein
MCMCESGLLCNSTVTTIVLMCMTDQTSNDLFFLKIWAAAQLGVGAHRWKNLHLLQNFFFFFFVVVGREYDFLFLFDGPLGYYNIGSADSELPTIVTYFGSSSTNYVIFRNVFNVFFSNKSFFLWRKMKYIFRMFQNISQKKNLKWKFQN